jgi:transposase
VDERAKKLRLKLAEILPLLNEKHRRALVASEAKAYGYGGQSVLARITGISRPTIDRGLRDLKKGSVSDRIRKHGGGRKKLTEKDPDLLKHLKDLLEPVTRGDPESPLKWTCKSVEKLASGLAQMGHQVSYRSVAKILHELDYSLQANRKTSEGKKDHPDRDDQFHYINDQAKAFLKMEAPVISVDTKKKELIGKYKNAGQEWQKKGRPVKVLSHDFPDPAVSRAVPYGVYDIAKNTGWVNVGIDGDTAEFAVESIRQWWQTMGRSRYRKAKQLMITADSGGSNSYRSHLWKLELQKFSNRTKLKITVCHFPPGTSKWNKIEHRLFSFITMNWRGRPLTDYVTVVNLIAATTTQTGLTVRARLDKNVYPRGIKVSKEELLKLCVIPHTFHGEWNYTIQPKSV